MAATQREDASAALLLHYDWLAASPAAATAALAALRAAAHAQTAGTASYCFRLLGNGRTLRLTEVYASTAVFWAHLPPPAADALRRTMFDRACGSTVRGVGVGRHVPEGTSKATCVAFKQYPFSNCLSPFEV